MSDKSSNISVSRVSEATETMSENEAEEEEKLRGNWAHHIEFILSCIGYAVGLGNVWRFPYQCYKNGGGAFLIVYWILSFSVGLPIMFLEQSLGQYTSRGPMHCWSYSPIFRGVGISMLAISFIGSIYYNVIIAWSLFMMFASFQSELPWAQCDYSSWADLRCELKYTSCDSYLAPELARSTNGLCYNTSAWSDASSDKFSYVTCPNVTSSVELSYVKIQDECLNFTSKNVAKSFANASTVTGYWNEELAIQNNFAPQLSTEQYFFHYVLGQYEGYNTENIGTPSWALALCLLLAWIMVFFSLINSIHSSGKVVYFTAVFPYIVLFVLIGRGVTLPGAMDGIRFYLKPEFSKLKQPSVWFSAANQLFFSLSVSRGGMLALSSYNKFENNALRDSIITVVADSLTSFTAGFAIFSIIGYGAHALDRPIDHVATAGTGLAFVMYPKVVLELPGSVAWAIVFFFMLLLLGLDSQFNGMETLITTVLDQFPQLRRSLKRKACFLAVLCTFLFLLGLPMICNGGSNLVQYVDEYSSGWGCITVGIVELVSLGWIYGTEKYHLDLKFMLGKTWRDFGKWYIFVFWRIIGPGILALILAYSFYAYTPIAGTQTDEAIGWCCAVFVLMWMPIAAVFEVVTATPGTSYFGRLRDKIKPSRFWGPYYVRHRQLVTHLGGNFVVDPRHVLKRQKSGTDISKKEVFMITKSGYQNPAFANDYFDETNIKETYF